MSDILVVFVAAIPAFLLAVVVWLFGIRKNGKFWPWMKGEGYQIFAIATIIIGAALHFAI